MNHKLEKRVLDLARERGLIGDEDLQGSASAADAVRRWGERLGSLVAAGAIEEADLAVLVGELTQGGLAEREDDPALDDADAPPEVDDPAASGEAEPVSSETRTNVFWQTDGRGGSAATVDVSGAYQATRASMSGFPAAEWERYEIKEFLGAGGMGKVYKAWDPRLQRHVALKFISRDDDEVIARFFREAQSQAQVEHAHVCRIYEVGEVDGQPYIAMQFIDGRPIHDARGEMSTEERVLALSRVADAVHAAHRLGLIHRDIKPSNILVERHEEGGWTPYILDFGLARKTEGEGLTMTGAPLGTPAYMAPEQARGESDTLDRRTDVYGLGATLYEVLGGHPPFDGSSPIEILFKAVENEPPSLAATAPTLPADLCNITGRAMEKEPGRRYDSARALAEDLRRYLDGEPVQARPQSLGYRLGKWVRRNRRLVTVAGLALAAVLVALGLLVQQRLVAAEQQRLAQRFSQEAAQIESLMWKDRAVPAHDTRPQKEAVRERMRIIEADMARLGRHAEGPGHHALGMAHLALYEPAEAQVHLQQAWDAGYETPEVAYGMALAMGDLYQQEREQVEAVYSKAERKQKLQEVALELRAPAVEWLRRAEESEHVAPDYALALVAFHEERLDDALVHAARALEGRPWLYEAWIMQGMVHSQRGMEQSLAGDKEAAIRTMALGEQAYLEAERIAPSDVRVLESLARLYMRRYTHRLLGEEGYHEDLVRMREVIDRGVVVDEERAYLQAQRCYAYEAEARVQYNEGVDFQASLAEGIRAGERAVELEPENVYARSHLGSIYGFQAWLAPLHGEDAGPPLRKAVDVLEGALAIQPTYTLKIETSRAYLGLAVDERLHGRDPVPSIELAEQHVRSAGELRPDASNPRLVLGEVQHLWGIVLAERGEDPTTQFQAALASMELRKEGDPFEGWFRYESGVVRQNWAQYEMSRGRDPRELLSAADADAARVRECRPNSAAGYELDGFIQRTRADYELHHGIEPAATLRAGRRAHEQVLALKPGLHMAHFNIGILHYLGALHAWRSGGDPRPGLALAFEGFERGIEGFPGIADEDPMPAAAHALAARDALDRGRTPMASVEAGKAYADHLLGVNPNHRTTLLALADLELSRARWEMASGGDPAAALTASDQALERARDAGGSDPRVLLLTAEVERQRAEFWTQNGRGTTPRVQALEAVEQALAIQPDLADALALRGRLHLANARDAEGDTDRRLHAGMSRDAFEAALSIDGNLERRVRGELAEARRLAR